MTTSTRYPSSYSVVSGSWSGVTNVYAEDTNHLQITRGTTKNSSDDIHYGGFGFDAQIPAGSTINSVTIEVAHQVSTTDNICYLECAPRISSTDGTFNSDGTEPTTETARSYGSQDRPGGGSWTHLRRWSTARSRATRAVSSGCSRSTALAIGGDAKQRGDRSGRRGTISTARPAVHPQKWAALSSC